MAGKRRATAAAEPSPRRLRNRAGQPSEPRRYVLDEAAPASDDGDDDFVVSSAAESASDDDGDDADHRGQRALRGGLEILPLGSDDEGIEYVRHLGFRQAL
jgi:hypothetical protein